MVPIVFNLFFRCENQCRADSLVRLGICASEPGTDNIVDVVPYLCGALSLLAALLA
jgi:hypothetical protein